ncbi:MAG: hypothetical protein WDZ35_12000 [Crocinitomicaceae bacterium]
MRLLTLFFLLLPFTGVCSETYINKEARFKVTFPAEYDEQTERAEGMTSVSVSCIYRGMMFFVSAFIYDEIIPKDQYATKIAEGIIITADSFNSKFKKRKLEGWTVDNQYPGLSNPIKGKLENPQGKKMKIIGAMNICMAHNIEFRISAFSSKKKDYEEDVVEDYVNSFSIL